MIYDYETDYRELLRAVLERTDRPERYEVDVECAGEDEMRIECRAEDRYAVQFEQGSDWLRFEALAPIEAALSEDSLERIYYRGGNDGWLLVLPEAHYELVAKYRYVDS
ncbi:hypothetical protein BRC81_11125 [Halobacteriales archaeon QS_1_68_20]|nr:MAG: hypothetical protein BRC81_11125 [Halobacteriales archaeon QS_1_68_20]